MSSNNLLNTLTENEPAIQQFLTKRLGCSQAAADVFQKIAEKLLEKKQASSITNQRAYLYQIARNEVVNHYRMEQQRSHYEADCALFEGELEYRDAERIAIANDSLNVLNQSLTELSLLTRQIFILYRIDGIKQKAIASQLGLNLSTVEKRLAIAIKHCRSCLRSKETYGLSASQTSPEKKQ